MNYRKLNTFSARYEVLRNGGVFATIYADGAPEIQYLDSSALKMSIRGTFFAYSDSIDFLTDRLRPVVTINGDDYPLGVFVITTEQVRRYDGAEVVELEGYSLLYLASRKRIEEPLHIASGTNYITQIVSLLSSCGLTDIEAEATTLTFSEAREDWDVGTPVLDIVNALLAEISYNSAWVENDGTVRLTAYTPPGIGNVAHVYSAGEASVIEGNYVKSTDRFAKYNVFRVTCDNPDKSAVMVAVAENSSADNPYSTANIGRVLYTEAVDNIPTQAALQTYANKLMYESLQETETVEFQTAINPEHSAGDTIALDAGDLSGIYREIEWRVSLSADGSMSHKVRRVITDG